MSKTKLIWNAYKSGHDYRDLAKRIGMVIPPWISETNGEKYFVDNYNEYETVLSRNPDSLNVRKHNLVSLCLHDRKGLKDYLQTLTDTELFRLFGYYVYYDSRVSLLEKLLTTLGGLEYFIPFDKNKNNDNKEEPLFICYGNHINFRSATTKNLETLDRLMEGQRLTEMKELLILLRSNRFTKDLTKAIKHVESKIKKHREWHISVYPASAKWL